MGVLRPYEHAVVPERGEALGYVYLPLTTPTNDYYGGHRPGDNLFAESIVCLDARTGERIWHFQAVHHGLWDYDFASAPNLVDITVDGRAIEAVAIVSKQAFTYVFDRAIGALPLVTKTLLLAEGGSAGPVLPMWGGGGSVVAATVPSLTRAGTPAPIP